ncbi:hypothetical protein [Rhodanobacter sp. C05]|uniref:hypothetical protein n=1 Tax=Rhodanobacter sp. C05 TaxID=1945855 RepID=UPI000986FF32|nr:hypothetical protein [Rhodanobacter sp. C05]OOG37477.1 hypothetical protein B0E51_16650 [Rhodanobacter sp. C05]
MRVTHWLIGCTLCIAGIGSAAATSLDTQEQDNAQHATADSASSRDGNSSGGDALGLTHDTPRATGSESSGSTSGNSSDRSSGASSAPAPSRQPHLGWQSLLPGSIQ